MNQHEKANSGDDKTLQIYDNFSLNHIEAWDKGGSHTAKYYDKAFPVKCSRILDIGIGSGRDMCILHNMGYEVYGVEPSELLINEAINRHAKDIRDITDRLIKSSLPYLAECKSNFYDGILCTTVLMHIPEEQLIDCAENIMRILKTNGHLLLSVPINAHNEEMPMTSLDSQNRDKQGRLFNPLPEAKLKNIFKEFTFIESWIDNDGLNRNDRKLLTVLFRF